MKWNEKVKKARKEAHFTQQDISDFMNVSRSTVANWELGRRKPNFLELKKLATKLRVDVNYILEGDEVEKEHDLITRASDVFSNADLPQSDKDAIFQDIMEIYMKGKKQSATTQSEHSKSTRNSS